jgi:hypothetical protein
MKEIFNLRYLTILSFTLLVISCEKEKKEYQQFPDESYFMGFTYGIFTIHENSIGYYNPDSGKVFADIYRHQNGHAIGNGVHSMSIFQLDEYKRVALITVEHQNKIEFIDSKSFLSQDSIEISHPRNVLPFQADCLISYGTKENFGHGIALVHIPTRSVDQIIFTGIVPGNMYRYDKYYYVLPDRDDNDSVMEVYYAILFEDGQLGRFTFADSVTIGNRPVEFIETRVGESGHSGLAILCLGIGNERSSVVFYDLIAQKKLETYYFEDPGFKPEHIFQFKYSSKPYFFVNANKKFYQVEFTQPMTVKMVIDKNINELKQLNGHPFFCAVSLDTVNQGSYLYMINNTTFAVEDSIPIEPGAKSLASIVWQDVQIRF